MRNNSEIRVGRLLAIGASLYMVLGGAAAFAWSASEEYQSIQQTNTVNVFGQQQAPLNEAYADDMLASSTGTVLGLVTIYALAISSPYRQKRNDS